MLKKLFLLAIASLGGGFLIAQTCATPFTTTSSSLNEICDTTGPDLYAITVTASSDSTLIFVGLYHELTPINADVDCNTGTFTIAPQHIFSGFYVTGLGSYNNPVVNIVYSVYHESDSSLGETCTGTYTGTAVGTASPLPQGLFVYPNPATGSVNIRLNDSHASSQWTYSIFDLQGRGLMTSYLGTELEAVVDLRSMVRGVYIVQLKGSNGEVMNRRLLLR